MVISTTPPGRPSRPSPIKPEDARSPRRRDAGAAAETAEFCGLRFHCLDLSTALDLVERRPAEAPFVYVTTPNVDHVVRASRDSGLRPLYEGSWLTVNDSRVLEGLASLKGLYLPAVPGATMLEELFRSKLRIGDSVTVVGLEHRAVELLQARFREAQFYHLNPPMGFTRDPRLLEASVSFILHHRSRFTLLAVGSPQQEILAKRVAETGAATGIGLCVGIAPAFLAGELKRAPGWVQSMGLEWLWRLMQEPRRLWRRYLLTAPCILPMALREILHAWCR